MNALFSERVKGLLRRVAQKPDGFCVAPTN